MTDPRDSLAWIETMPAGSLVPVEAVRDALRAIGPTDARPPRPSLDSWRERLWSAPADTRIGVKELAAAVGHSSSWVWKRTAPTNGTPALPHRKRDGELVFVVGEVRAWLTALEAPPGPQAPHTTPAAPVAAIRMHRSPRGGP